MSTSVDTKIVELKFNNDNFAEKVDSTLTKLEQLNKDIKAVGVNQALKNFNKNIKQVDVTPISNGVEEVNKSFSKMEIVGMTALVNLTNAAVNFGKKLVSKLISPITKGVMEGGLARARNIEQATFSFEGQKIGKSAGNESLSYYKEVMDAVLGTSYSYDVAAKAASQLAASNIGVEKTIRKLADGSKVEAKVLNGDMTKALLGIAGVASMTGSSFDDISQIFTRVAGQGKVMAVDLNSIAARGLNATAIIAQYLGKTEEQVHEMVRKGQVDFETFSIAMEKAFGAHAKDSTLQFQGAMDDVQAAMARIGADFYGPALEAGRDILNSITPLVDAIHNKLTPALEGSETIMGKASKSLSQYLDMLSYLIEMYPEMDSSKMGEWISEHMNAWTNIADLYKRGDVKEAITGLEAYTKGIKGMKNEGIDAYQMIGDYLNVQTNRDILGKYLNKTDKELDKIVDKAKLSAEDLQTVINGLVDDGVVGFNVFYKSFHKLWSESDKLMSIADIYTVFNEYTDSIIQAEGPSNRFTRHLETFKKIIDGSVTVWNSFTTILGAFGDVLLTISEYMAPLEKWIVEVTTNFAKFAVDAAEFVSKSNSFSNGILTLGKSLALILGGIVDIFLAIAPHLTPIFNLLVNVVAEFAKFVVKVSDFMNTSESFGKMLDGLVMLVEKALELLHISKLASITLSGITKAFEFMALVIQKVYSGITTLISTIIGLLQKLADKFTDLITNVEDLSRILNAIKGAGIILALTRIVTALLRPAEILDIIRNTLKTLSISIESTLTTVQSVFFQITKIGKGVNRFIHDLTLTLEKMQTVLVATAIIEIAIAIGILALALYALSKVHWDNSETLAATLLAFAGIVSTIWAMSKVIGNIKTKVKIWEKSVDSVKAIGFAFIEMAAAIAIMAGAIYKLSKVKPDDLMNATLVVETLLITLTVITKLLSSTVTKDTGLKALFSGKKTTTNMTKGIFSLIAMAEAVKILSKALVNIASVGDPQKVYTALGAVEAMIFSLAGIVKWLSGDKASKMAKGVTALLAMAVAVRLLTKPVLEFAKIDSDSLMQGVLAVGALMGGLGLMVKFMSGSKGAIRNAVGILIIASAIKKLQDTVVEFSKLDGEALVKGLGGVIGMLAGIVITLDVLDSDKILAKAVALAVVAHILANLQNVVLAFGENNDSAWAGLASLTYALLLLFGAVTLFKKAPIGGILKLFVTLMLGAVVVTAFGVAVGIFGTGLIMFGIGLNSLGSGVKNLVGVLGPFIAIMGTFAVAIGILSSVGWPAIVVILALGAAFLLLGIGMQNMGQGLDLVANSIVILTKYKDDLGDTVDHISVFVGELKKLTDDAVKIGEDFSAISDPFVKINEAAKGLIDTLKEMTSEYETMMSQTSSSIKTIADSITTLTNFRTSALDRATLLISNFITAMKEMASDAESATSTATTISNAMFTMKNATDAVIGSFNDFEKKAYGAFSTIIEQLNGILTPIESLKALQGKLDGLASDIREFLSELSGMSSYAQIIEDNSVILSDALNRLGNSVKDISKHFDSLNQNMGYTIGFIADSTKRMATAIDALANTPKILPKVTNAIDKFYNKLEKWRDSSSAISNSVKIITDTLITLGKEAKKTANLSAKDMVDSGKKMAKKLAEGIEKGEREVEQSTKKVISNVSTKVKTKGNRDNWKSIGSYLIGGLISGIREMQYSLEIEVQKLESAAERAVKAKAKVKSPSKVWAKIGTFLGLGLVVGLKAITSQVANAAAGLAVVSEKALTSALGIINSDVDVNPTIKPVIDLSEVSKGASYINDAFGAEKLGSITGTTLAGNIYAIQNEGSNSLNKMLNKISDSLSESGTTQNNYITVEGSGDPELVADRVVRRLQLKARTAL